MALLAVATQARATHQIKSYFIMTVVNTGQWFDSRHLRQSVRIRQCRVEQAMVRLQGDGQHPRRLRDGPLQPPTG